MSRDSLFLTLPLLDKDLKSILIEAFCYYWFQHAYTNNRQSKMMKHDDTSTTESGSDLLMDVANNEKSNLIISDINNGINNSYHNTEPYQHQFDESHDRSSFDHRHHQQQQQQQQHLGSSRQYWRDIILGVNDGIISTFLLISGVVGSQMNCREILLTSISGSLAGAVSMCAGTYNIKKT